MYCAGNLIEAAVAHHHATGDRKLLDALSRYADHMDATFGREEGKRRGYDGHPEVELALVRLYHETGEARYRPRSLMDRGVAPSRRDRLRVAPRGVGGTFGPRLGHANPGAQVSEVS